MREEPLIKVSYTTLDPYTVDMPDICLCLAYWEQLRGERLAPSWSEFDWNVIPANIIPCFGVVDVSLEPLDFVYRFWGSDHTRVHHQELTGKSVLKMRPVAERQSIFAQYHETLKAERPLLFANIIQDEETGIEVTELSLRLPLSDDGLTINRIVAYSNIRNDLEKMERAFSSTPRGPWRHMQYIKPLDLNAH